MFIVLQQIFSDYKLVALCSAEQYMLSKLQLNWMRQIIY